VRSSKTFPTLIKSIRGIGMLGGLCDGMFPVWIEDDKIRIRAFGNGPFSGIKPKDLRGSLTEGPDNGTQFESPFIDPSLINHRKHGF
jgi:hypothetical protein